VGRDTILETPRFVFREMSLDDLDFVASMLADPEVMRFYPHCYSREQAKGWIDGQMDRYTRHGHGLWIVVEKASGRPVGQVGLLIQHVDGVDETEVGYMIHQPFWRQGFATEAAAACRDHAFQELNRPRVISLIRPVNIPSQRVALRLGMKPEKMTRHWDLEHLVFSEGKPDCDS